MSGMKRFRAGDSAAKPWRDDPTTMIQACVTDATSTTMACGYLDLTKTAVKSTIDFDEIIVVLTGQFRSRSDGQTHDCRPGDILWIPANTAFTLETDSEARLFWAKYPAKTAVPPKT
ncbi:MAG: AraC family ligand binding domain-containing protein [Alphaproteobacteria bacterium]